VKLSSNPYNDTISICIFLADKLYERLDFQLREGTMSSSYVNSFTAHTSYWNDPDVAMYMLLQLYKYQPSAPPPLGP